MTLGISLRECDFPQTQEMSLYRVEAQYHDLTGSTAVDPSRIPNYPINDALRSVAGRNIAGAAWDYLAAKQAQAA